MTPPREKRTTTWTSTSSDRFPSSFFRTPRFTYPSGSSRTACPQKAKKKCNCMYTQPRFALDLLGWTRSTYRLWGAAVSVRRVRRHVCRTGRKEKLLGGIHNLQRRQCISNYCPHAGTDVDVDVDVNGHSCVLYPAIPQYSAPDTYQWSSIGNADPLPRPRQSVLLTAAPELRPCHALANRINWRPLFPVPRRVKNAR